MQSNRPLTIIIQCLVLTAVVFGLRPKLLDSFEDNHAEIHCLKSVFDEYVRPLFATTYSNRKILVNLPSTTLRHQEHILKMFQEEYAVTVNSSVNAAIYVLFCTHYAEVTDTIKRWKLSTDTWHSTASVIIFLKDTSESYWKIRQIPMIFMNNTLSNVHVISIGIKKIEVVTWSPYVGGGVCGKNIRNLQVVAECILESTYYRATNPGLNLNKSSVNIHHRCPFKAISIEWSPYSFFSSKIGSYAGFEVTLLKAFADKMHLDRIMIESSNSTVSSKEQLRYGQADLIIGGMSSDVSDHRDLSSTAVYSSDDITWCIASAKQVPRWQNMFLIVPGYMWLIFWTSGYACSFLLYKLLKFDPGTYHSLHVVSMIVMQTVYGIPTYFNPRNSCVRAFYSMLLFVGVAGITILTAFFIKFLTLPIYNEQVDSMDEIASNGYKLCGQNETLSFYNHHQDLVSTFVQQNYKKCAGSIDNNLAELATNDKLAVAVSRLHANNCPLIASHQIFCLQNENIINFPIAIIVRKDFYLLSKINEFLRQALESGLVQKWKMDFGMYDFKHTESHERIALTMEHLFGAFLVLYIGLITALVIFVAEHLMYFYMVSRRSDEKSAFWCTIERCICIPERVYFLEK